MEGGRRREEEKRREENSPQKSLTDFLSLKSYKPVFQKENWDYHCWLRRLINNHLSPLRLGKGSASPQAVGVLVNKCNLIPRKKESE
jgi:hypothetical protein